MALIVETGAGIPNADSWATMQFADQYAGRVGNALWVDGDAELKEPAMRRGATYLIGVYGQRFPGQRANPPADQSLPWPRKNVVDDDGYEVPVDLVPNNLMMAQVEAAFLEFARPGSTTPTAGARIQKSVTVGPLSVTYEDSKGQLGPGAQPVFSVIDGLMAPLLDRSKETGVAFLQRA